MYQHLFYWLLSQPKLAQQTDSSSLTSKDNTGHLRSAVREDASRQDRLLGCVTSRQTRGRCQPSAGGPTYIYQHITLATETVDDNFGAGETGLGLLRGPFHKGETGICTGQVQHAKFSL